MLDAIFGLLKSEEILSTDRRERNFEGNRSISGQKRLLLIDVVKVRHNQERICSCHAFFGGMTMHLKIGCSFETLVHHSLEVLGDLFLR